jgi:hypothetical protein
MFTRVAARKYFEDENKEGVDPRMKFNTSIQKNLIFNYSGIFLCMEGNVIIRDNSIEFPTPLSNERPCTLTILIVGGSVIFQILGFS